MNSRNTRNRLYVLTLAELLLHWCVTLTVDSSTIFKYTQHMHTTYIDYGTTKTGRPACRQLVRHNTIQTMSTVTMTSKVKILLVWIVFVNFKQMSVSLSRNLVRMVCRQMVFFSMDFLNSWNEKLVAVGERVLTKQPNYI